MPRCWGPGVGARQRPEVRQLRQGDVDLQRGARVADPLDVGNERLRKCAPVEQPQERHVGVGVARHDRGVVLVAAGERHADGPAVAHQDALHLGLAANVGAEVAGGCRQRLRQPAHAAAHVGPDTSRAAALAHHVVEQHVRGPRHRGGCHRPDDRVGRQRRLQLLRLEPAVEDRPRGAGEDLHRLACRVSQPPVRASEREQRPEVAEARLRQIGRRHRQRGLDHRRDTLEHRLVLRIALGVARAELGDLPARELGVGAHHQGAPVGKRRERRGVAGEDLVAVGGQPQVADDRRVEEAVDVRGGGDLVAGKRLLGDAGAADDVAPLEHEHTPAGSRQVAGRDQPVVPGADDDRVEARGARH